MAAKTEYDTTTSVSLSEEDMSRIKEGLKDLVDRRISVMDVQVPPHPPTLRDQFAMAALTGVIRTCKADTLDPGQTTEQHFANKAYAVADAMLAAREAK